MPQPIVPSSVLARIWMLYRSKAAVLLPAAVILFAIQLVLQLLISSAAVLLLIMFFSVLYQGFVVEVVAQDRVGAQVSGQGDLLRAVAPALGSLILISIVVAIGVVVGLFLIVIPGLVLFTLWAVAVPAEVIERRGVFASLGRSTELVRGNAWRVFGVIVGIYLTVVIIIFLVAILTSTLGVTTRDLVQWAVSVALMPLTALSASVLYFELIDAHAGPEVRAAAL